MTKQIRITLEDEDLEAIAYYMKSFPKLRLSQAVHALLRSSITRYQTLLLEKDRTENH